MEAYREETNPSVLQYKISFFHNNAQTAQRLVDLHWHEAYEVLYIRRGQAEQRLNADTIVLYPGDVVLIRPGDLHATEAISLKGCDIDVVQFSNDFFSDADCAADMLQSGVMCRENDGVQRLFDALCRYEQDDGAGQKMFMAGLVQMVAGFLLHDCSRRDILPKSSAINAICTYIEQTQNLQLETVAAHFDYSPEHLSRKFHKEMGMPYRRWCEQIRMRRGMTLLNDADSSISDVADILGYSDDSSFIRAFRRVYGITPSAYRRRRISILSEAERVQRQRGLR